MANVLFESYCLADGLFSVQGVGRMSPADIPLSAVDFHVSSIADELSNDKELAALLRVTSLQKRQVDVLSPLNHSSENKHA